MNLKQQIAASDAKITKLEFALAVEREVNLRLRSVSASPAESQSPNGDSPATVRGSIADHVAKLLAERKKPMRGRDIARRLEERGVSTSAKAGMLAMVLSTIRRRSDLFQRVRRGVYRLKPQAEDKA